MSGRSPTTCAQDPLNLSKLSLTSNTKNLEGNAKGLSHLLPNFHFTLFPFLPDLQAHLPTALKHNQRKKKVLKRKAAFTKVILKTEFIKESFGEGERPSSPQRYLGFGRRMLEEYPHKGWGKAFAATPYLCITLPWAPQSVVPT